MKIDLDHARFDRDVRRLSYALKVPFREAVEGQARLFVRDCIRATPPFSPGKNWTESLSKQHQVGKQATGGQVRDLFKDIRELDLFRKTELGKAGRAGRSFRKLIREGRMNEAVELANKLGLKVRNITTAATSSIHSKFRDRLGRIKRRQLVHVINASSIERLANRKISHVGLAKSGWALAARNLKLGLPKWIKSHAGQGIFQRIGDAIKPGVIVGNAVPFIQGTGMELGIMKWAFNNRLRNLPKQIERTLKAQMKKAGATVK